MIDPEQVPPVAPSEQLARYVTQSGQFRAGDRTVKPDLFIPHPRKTLSVTRHLDATEAEIWQVGEDVAGIMGRRLYGRADIQAKDCNIESLIVSANPIINKPNQPDNPNHADIEGWPSAKQDQKAIANKLAAFASKLKEPLQDG